MPAERGRESITLRHAAPYFLKNVGDGDLQRWKSGRFELLVGANPVNICVSACGRKPVNLYDLLDEIHEPELGDAGRGVECRLDAAILLQRSTRNLDHEQRLAGVSQV